MDPYEGDPQAPISLHRYMYANSSPLSYQDPNGRFALLDVLVGITTVSILTSLAIKPSFQLLGVIWQEKPDDDGIVTFAEANWQWKHGHGGALNADLSMINFCRITEDDFKTNPQAFNLLSDSYFWNLNDVT